MFKIPFKNVGDDDIEVEFKFFNASQAVNEAALKRSSSMGTDGDENQSPVEFNFVDPKPIKLLAGMRT